LRLVDGLVRAGARRRSARGRRLGLDLILGLIRGLILGVGEAGQGDRQRDRQKAWPGAAVADHGPGVPLASKPGNRQAAA
jgi:hypothetical protein